MEHIVLAIEEDGRVTEAIRVENDMIHIKECLTIIQRYLKEVLQYDIEEDEVLAIITSDGTIKWKAIEI